MPDQPPEDEILLPFERQALSGNYREYFKTKRVNFFSMIQQHNDLWRYHLLLDEIWLRDIGDLQVAIDLAKSIPMLFFIAAHAKIRISIELAFSGCPQEARSIMRDAVESAAFGHRMLQKPELQEVWLKKDDPDGRKPFTEAFEKEKRSRLFAGLEELHRMFTQLSEIGSHPTPLSLSTRLKTTNVGKSRSFNISYTGHDSDEKGRVTALFSLLLTAFAIENTFFKDYEIRLGLDHELVDERRRFNDFKEALRKNIISKYKIAAPG